MAITAVTNVIVPSIFTPYAQLLTEEKSRLIQSGVLVRDAALDALLEGGGLTFNTPSWKDLVNDDENISTDTTYDYAGTNNSAPKNTSAVQEVAVRLSRNQSWSAADLAGSLAGSDPMASIGQRVADYWKRRLQAAFVATMKGIFADNDAAPSGSEHTAGDLTSDISGSSYSAGVTDFSAEAFINAAVLLGDSMEDLGVVFMHSVVYARAQKNNLIDFIPDARGEVNIPTFLGREVVVDDSMPVSSGVYQTWLFGRGAVRLGVGTPPVATEVARMANAGNGGGQDVLHNRVEWTIHPVGHKYAGTAASGGPTNANSSNNLAHAGSWMRVYSERKQIKISRLITRES
jgi:hypothetical protein